MSFDHTVEVILLIPVVFCAIAIPIGLLIMLIERLTGWDLTSY